MCFSQLRMHCVNKTAAAFALLSSIAWLESEAILFKHFGEFLFAVIAWVGPSTECKGVFSEIRATATVGMSVTPDGLTVSEHVLDRTVLDDGVTGVLGVFRDLCPPWEGLDRVNGVPSSLLASPVNRATFPAKGAWQSVEWRVRVVETG